MYTRLDFSPYSPKRWTLLSQANFLLSELEAGRIHEFPCCCGACVHWAYRHRKKGEGGSFSSRTFFVFYLRNDLFMKALADSYKRTFEVQVFKKDPRLEVGDYLIGPTFYAPRLSLEKYSTEAQKKYRSLKKKYGRARAFRETPHAREIWLNHVKDKARTDTLALLRELLQTQKTPAIKKLLRTILNKRSFYVYYNRAGNEKLGRIISEIQKKLMSTAERRKSPVEFWATSEGKNSIKGDKITLPRKCGSFDKIPGRPRK